MNAVIQKQESLPTLEPTTLLQVISRAASDPNYDIDKMERLMAMHERLLQQQAKTAFNDAMAEAQKEMLPISQDATNPQTRSKYASYNQLDKALRPVYTRHGFSISYDTDDSPKADHVRVLAYVCRGGFERTYKVDMPADGKGAKGGDVMTKTHATGAAVAYGKRYLLKAIFNVAEGEGDRDGNEDAPTLSEDQIANLRALLTEVKASEASFLKWARCKSLSEILAKNYHECVKAIEAKRK